MGKEWTGVEWDREIEEKREIERKENGGERGKKEDK